MPIPTRPIKKAFLCGSRSLIWYLIQNRLEDTADHDSGFLIQIVTIIYQEVIILFVGWYFSVPPPGAPGPESPLSALLARLAISLGDIGASILVVILKVRFLDLVFGSIFFDS